MARYWSISAVPVSVHPSPLVITTKLETAILVVAVVRRRGSASPVLPLCIIPIWWLPAPQFQPFADMCITNFRIIIIFFCLVLYAQGLRISRCKSASPEWLRWELENCERVDKAHCIEMLICHGNTLVQKRSFPRIGNYYYCKFFVRICL